MHRPASGTAGVLTNMFWRRNAAPAYRKVKVSRDETITKSRFISILCLGSAPLGSEPERDRCGARDRGEEAMGYLS